MLKTSALVIGGLAAGFAIAALWPEGERETAPAFGSTSEARRIADLEFALAAEAERRAALERRVEALDDDLAALAAATEQRTPVSAETLGGAAIRGAERALTEAAEGVAAAEPVRPFARGQRFQPGPEAWIEQLVNGGFTPQRAEWLAERAEELRMEALQAVYDARREGKPLDPRAIAGEQSLLRNEIGDAEYEQYLQALGRPTSVGVGNVLASSPAAAAGLQSGDRIVSYGGARVFDMSELNRLTYEGEPGQPVILEVVRDGQSMQIVIPRGPIGIAGGRYRQ
jgi:hypothetical protein